MKILLSNDDGIKADGLRALVDGLSGGQDEIVVSAPATERSASSHSITLGENLRVELFSFPDRREFAVHGTPADSVKFAVAEIKNFVPDLVISGINHGANTGISVYYSGTISAAREAYINRYSAIAVSLCSRDFRDFSASVSAVKMLIEGFRSGFFPPHLFLNVNVPPLRSDQLKGIKITKQADSRFIEEFIKESEHDGKRIYRLAGEMELLEPDGTSDEEAVHTGFVSVTPLKLDLTRYEVFDVLNKWLLQGDEK